MFTIVCRCFVGTGEVWPADVLILKFQVLTYVIKVLCDVA